MPPGHPILFFKSLWYMGGAWAHSNGATAVAVLNPADLAALLSQDWGKPLPESQNEIRYAANFVKWLEHKVVEDRPHAD
ncbi:hypothetical protein [Paraburkholderia fungorum]|uniref:Uncharacterized protein n=1 Tax=Paraburkholderia fungorum TaxID=134537 RepID=A0A3R7EWN4_9BURK|nr:hypothetical protein BCY88_02670 [Paraburkholderia fungorum]